MLMIDARAVAMEVVVAAGVGAAVPDVELPQRL